MLGPNILKIESKPEITNIEKMGFWILTSEGEFFVSFDKYPDFRCATLDQVFNFKTYGQEFHWEELDVDIDIDALKFPEKYPLVYERNKR